MTKITDKKQANRMVLLFMFTYMVSYITRINYGAVIAEITSAEHIKNSVASLALTGSSVTYGAGQLVSGYLGDKFQPKKLVFWGLITTITTNLLLPLCTDAYQMTAVWCVNGFAQAFMWPPLVRLMTALFDAETYKKACVYASWGSSFGTIAVYLMSPVCIGLAGWKLVFVVSAVCAVFMAVLWMKKCPIIESEPREKTEESASAKLHIPQILLLAGVMLAIVLMGALRDGVTTWMPSFVADSFHLDQKIAILTGVILPLFSIATFQITSVLYRKKVPNELRLSGLIFLTGFVSALLLALCGGWNAAAAVLFSALLTGCMHGINLMLNCMVPPYFYKFGRVSFISGLLNSCTYVGSALSVYGFAVFSEHVGWMGTIYLWSAIALAGALICLALQKKWSNFSK